jgi:hypothetical protein
MSSTMARKFSGKTTVAPMAFPRREELNKRGRKASDFVTCTVEVLALVPAPLLNGSGSIRVWEAAGKHGSHNAHTGSERHRSVATR